MVTKTHAVLILGLTLLLAGALAAQQKPEDIPDAPSATRPIPPPEPPSPRQEAGDETQPNAAPADNSGAGVTTGSKEMPRSAPDSASEKAGEKAGDRADEKPAHRRCLRSGRSPRAACRRIQKPGRISTRS